MKWLRLLYLSIYSIGFLAPAVEKGPTFVFNIADVNIISIVFPKRDSSPAKHKQVVSVQNRCLMYTEDSQVR